MALFLSRRPGEGILFSAGNGSTVLLLFERVEIPWIYFRLDGKQQRRRIDEPCVFKVGGETVRVLMELGDKSNQLVRTSIEAPPEVSIRRTKRTESDAAQAATGS